MDLTPHVDALRHDLALAATAMGPEMEQAADRLAYAIDASTRLVLLDSLAEAAADITTRLEGWSVEVRLRGREPVFTVVGAGPAAVSVTSTNETVAIPEDDTSVMSQQGESDETSRITLRIPEALKAIAEEQAAGRGQSLNTWLVNAVRAATVAGLDRADGSTLGPGAPGRNRASNKRVQGWVR